MLSPSHPKIHEPPVTGVSPRPTDQRGARKLRNTRCFRNTSSTTTLIARTARCISSRPQAPLPHRPERHSGRCDEIDSAASYTSICRSHDVSGFSAPTGLRLLGGAGESDMGGGFRALWVPTDLGVCWAGCAVGRRRHRADEGIRKALPVSLGRVRPGGPCRARRRCVHGRDRRCPSRGMAHRR